MTRPIPTRLVLVERPGGRDYLHGAWWPRTTNLELELVPMITHVASRFGAIRGVMLNRGEWPDTPITWNPYPNRQIKISWYGNQDPNTAVLLCSVHRIALLVVPPETTQAVASSAMAMARKPGNVHTSVQTLQLAEISA